MATRPDGSQEAALKRALRFLGYCPRSEAEVQAKLARLGFSQEVIERTLEKLRSLNYLNDEIFARGWARSRAEGRGYGPLRIERELTRRGIPARLIGQVVRETCSEREVTERVRRLLEKRFGAEDLADPRILRRAVAFLQRRGYRDSVIGAVLRAPLED